MQFAVTPRELASPVGSWSALIVAEDPGFRQSVRLCMEADGARGLGVSRPEAAIEALARSRFDCLVLEMSRTMTPHVIDALLQQQPDLAIVIVASVPAVDIAVEAMRRGAWDYLGKPLSIEALRTSLRCARARAGMNEATTDAASGGDDQFDSSSPPFRVLLRQAARAAATEAPILLRGESGTGKNVLARWIWQHSRRSAGPFVSVNCPALSNELMNSTLFGHKRGAFTGATADAPGKVQDAEGGTLFLDEVGDLSLDAQVRLLRFLNDRTYERVGEARERRADVRLVAATNRPIEDEVRQGRFRDDLLFRLNVVTLVLPPLRDRAEDILPLARHYLARAAARQGRAPLELSEAAAGAIARYAWPGNLRELRHAVERAAILSHGPRVEVEDLGILGSDPTHAAADEIAVGADLTLEALEREHIARVIARAPTLEIAAQTLGIDASTLQRKRKRYGLA